MKTKEEKIINDLVYFDNLKIVQNKNYFNFSLDSILLPNFAPITENTKLILDLCTGNAPVPLVLTTKTNAKIIGVELQKDTPVTEEGTTVDISLTSEDTKIGEVINKDMAYWYEVELNPETRPQTIIGYEIHPEANMPWERIFLLLPEGSDK